jgi:hypothetical protein
MVGRNMLIRIWSILFILFITSGCSSVHKSDEIKAVYKVIDRNCQGTEDQIINCENIALLEFVNGNFYKVSNNEIAFVLWYGESELTYTARKYEGAYLIDSYPFTLTIDKESKYLETIIFASKNKGTYSFGKSSEAGVSSLQFQRATDEDITDYVKEYPGNE